MRVVAGKAKGTALKAPNGMATRPTADKVKEAMFSIVQFDLPGARVLDLFGGTGQLGIEAVSRGAKTAVIVDASTPKLSSIALFRASRTESPRVLVLMTTWLVPATFCV